MDIDIGTCSWNYPSWDGLVYSGSPDTNRLKEYSSRFRTVEVDRWFWSLFGKDSVRMPDRETVEEYNESTPEHFRFAIKVPNSISLTHFYKKDKSGPLIPNPHFLSRSLFDMFLETLRPLEKKVSILMFEFEYLNKQKMENQDLFLELVSSFMETIPGEFPVGIEVRNPQFINEKYFSFLKEHGISHVFTQGYWMPPVWEIYETWSDCVTGMTVIRLMGPDRQGIEKKSGKKWNRIIEPKDDELDKIALMIEYLLKRDVKTGVYVNNHYEGSAPITVDRIQKLLISRIV